MDFRLTFLVLSLLLINYSSAQDNIKFEGFFDFTYDNNCLLYTSPSPRDLSTSRMPSSA